MKLNCYNFFNTYVTTAAMFNGHCTRQRALAATPVKMVFTLDCNNKGTRGHLAKLSKPRCQKDVRKYFFSHRVIDRWNALDGETVSSSSTNVFKNRLIRMTRMGYFMDYSH